MTKQFTETDIHAGNYPTIYADRSELIDAPTSWQRLGLMETATGYGRRLNSGLKIHFNGKIYRIYTTIFSNVGSNWFVSKGRKIFVN